MKKSTLIIKAIITLLLILSVSIYENVYMTLLTNDVAINQLSNTSNSYTNMKWITFLNNNLHIMLFIIIIIIFASELINLLKKLFKGSIEENN